MKRLILCSFLCVPVVGLSACGSSGSDGASGGTSSQTGGGNSQSGGALGTGGSTPGQGGTSHSGGSSTEGGASGSSSGGEIASGGRTSTGGSRTEGGSGGGQSGGSSAGGAAGRPNLPGDSRLVDLEATQKADLCDWYADVLGGYGYVAQCGMNPKTFYKDQAECVSLGLDFNCDRITVDNLVECVQAQIPSGGCDFPTAHCHWLFCE